MNNMFFFLLWSKSLWKKNKIISFISEHFEIESIIKVRWAKRMFAQNLSALYGRKLVDERFKMEHCGKGMFYVVVFKDKSPNYQTRETTSGDEIVNINTFDAKTCFRKWTGGGHRIHGSNTIAETERDLTILFGPNYLNTIMDYNGRIYSKNTVGINGFNDMQKLCDTLKRIGDNYVFKLGTKKILIICKSAKDLCSAIRCERKENNTYDLKINKMNLEIIIFGENEGELPDRLLPLVTQEIEELHLLNSNTELLYNVLRNKSDVIIISNKKICLGDYRRNKELLYKKKKWIERERDKLSYVLFVLRSSVRERIYKK